LRSDDTFVKGPSIPIIKDPDPFGLGISDDEDDDKKDPKNDQNEKDDN